MNGGMLQDVFLFTGDFKWMFYFTLVGFLLANARNILGATPNINFFHGCALMVLANFGGSATAHIMCGQPVGFVCNEALISCCFVTWTVVYLFPEPIISALKDNPIGRQLHSATFEIQRCHVLMNCSNMAAATLPPALAVPAPGRVAIIGPLIAGLLGGCGGGFMPLNKGLDPLASGLNWRMASAAINSLWLLLATQHPDTMAMLGLDVDFARFLAVSFFVVVPIIESATGMNFFGANPLVAGPAEKTKKA